MDYNRTMSMLDFGFDMRNVGENIKKYMLRSGLTRSQVEFEMGAAPLASNHWVYTHYNMPTPVTLVRLSEIITPRQVDPIVTFWRSQGVCTDEELEEVLNDYIAGKIANLARKRWMTRNQLMDASHRERHSAQRVWTGERSFTTTDVVYYARYFGVPVTDLIPLGGFDVLR